MEVRTISCSKKITAELAINVDTIEYKYSSIHGDSFELPFSISVGDGSNYHGEIVYDKKYLFCYVYDVKDLTGKVSMMISEGNFISKELTPYSTGYSEINKISNAEFICVKVASVTFLKGSLIITFEPKEKKIMEEGLIYALLKQDQLEGPNDVTLVVQGKEFEFNMSCLAKIR